MQRCVQADLRICLVAKPEQSGGKGWGVKCTGFTMDPMAHAVPADGYILVSQTCLDR